MQTQCPHCETRFRVTESQVNIAEGFVRCSVCEEVFNAFDVAEHDELSNNTSTEDETAKNNFSEDETSVDDTPEQNLTEYSLDNEAAPSEVDLSESENNDTEQSQKDDVSADVPAVNENEKNELHDELAASDNEVSDEAKIVDFNNASATDDSRKEAFDFFDEEENEPLSHVVPEQYKQAYDSSTGSLLSNILWGIGTLLLVTTLAIEYIWFNRDQLNQMPQLQAWTEKLCQRFECKNISMRNPKQIELVSRNVYSHPNEKNALMVNITMKNLANFAQPYPIMQIKFSDVRGGSVAARRFLPSEYLPTEMRQMTTIQAQLFEADTNMTFTMEIQDPGKQAMTYEFDFL